MNYEKVLGEHKFPTYEELKTGLIRLIDEGKISREDASRLLPELRESEDERTRKRAIAILKQQRAYWSYDGPIDKFPPATPRKDLVDAIDVAISYLEKQKEQKPVDYDHEMWKNCEANFEGGKKEVIENPERYGLQKPAEWSEEDENKIESIKGLITMGRFADTNTIRTIWELLDSLRPSWKPSEEHLSALLAVFNDPNNIGSQTCQLALTDLYEQLKKL